MYKSLNNYLDIANSIKADVNPESYDKDFGGSVNEPISAGLNDFATASKQMNFRFKSLNEDSSNHTKLNVNDIKADEEDDVSPDYDLSSLDYDSDDDFGKFLRDFKTTSNNSTPSTKPELDNVTKGIKLSMDDYADIDWNQSPDTLVDTLGKRTRKLIDERTLANNINRPVPNNTTSAFGEDLDTKIANNQIQDAVYSGARNVIKLLDDDGIIEQYDTGLDNDADFIKNKMIETIYEMYGDKPSLREKIEKLLVSDLKSSNGDISHLVEIYTRKH